MRAGRMLLAATAAVAGLSVPAASTAVAAPKGLAVTPSTGLVDGQRVSVVLRGAAATSVWAVAECGPGALSFYLDHSRPSQDGCEQRASWVLPVDAGGMGARSVSLATVLTTAAGAVDCRVASCFIALQELTSLDGSGLKLSNLSFSPDACAAARSCRTAADAWSPLAGRPSFVPGPVADSSTGAGIAEATPGSPAGLSDLAPLDATASPGRAAPGPASGQLDSGLIPASGGVGQGVLALTMSAPGTSWGPGTASAVVADVTVTDATTSTTLPTQQVVLHRGASSFTYDCALGAISATDRFSVAIEAETDARFGGLSQLPAKKAPTGLAGQTARIVVADAAVLWIDQSSDIGLADRYAPIVYGRSTSALHDTPLILDATVSPGNEGGHQIDYTEIFSHEDAGTAYVPGLELTTWGRLSDIETFVHLEVDASGAVTSGSYFWGGVPKSGYPDSDGALQEVSKPFSLAARSQWEGTHPVIRVATGNNDVVAGSRSAFRFQQSVVAGPEAGATRESVMAAHPFTYAAMAEEAGRWYSNRDETPSSMEYGDASQYAIADLATSSSGGAQVDGIALEVEVAGSWFASDQGWGYPLVGVGHRQLTVKLPVGWSPGQIEGVRVAVSPASSASAVSVDSLDLSSLAGDGSISPISTPSPTVVGRTATVSPVISLQRAYAGSEHARSGYLVVRVTDALGFALDGIKVTMALPTGAQALDCQTCSKVSGKSGTTGSRSSGLALLYFGVTPPSWRLPAGTKADISSEDKALAPVSMSLDFGGA